MRLKMQKGNLIVHNPSLISSYPSKYNELTRSLSSLFPQFQNASARLIEELTRKAQDLEAQEELHRTRAENDRATIARLQEDNLALQQIKQVCFDFNG